MSSAAKPPSFQWYPRDCDSDERVRLMDDAELGFYLRCLNHAWLNDGLPSDIVEIARIFQRNKRQIEKYWARVGPCFVLMEGRFKNLRQEEQRKAATDFQQSRRAAANTRWDKSRSKTDARACASASADAPQAALHLQSSASASSSATASAIKTGVARAVSEWAHAALFEAAWHRHLKFRGKGEHLPQLTAQILIGTDEQIDWRRLEEIHPKFCDYWARRGWDFCPLTLLEWIQAGLPAPPPEATTGARPARNANDDWAKEEDRKAREEGQGE